MSEETNAAPSAGGPFFRALIIGIIVGLTIGLFTGVVLYPVLGGRPGIDQSEAEARQPSSRSGEQFDRPTDPPPTDGNAQPAEAPDEAPVDPPTTGG